MGTPVFGSRWVGVEKATLEGFSGYLRLRPISGMLSRAWALKPCALAVWLLKTVCKCCFKASQAPVHSSCGSFCRRRQRSQKLCALAISVCYKGGADLTPGGSGEAYLVPVCE